MEPDNFSKKPQQKNRDNRYIILSARVLCLFSGISIALFTLSEHFGSTGSGTWAQTLTVACIFIGLPILAFWVPLCSSIASIVFVVYFIVIRSITYSEIANITQSDQLLIIMEIILLLIFFIGTVLHFIDGITNRKR